MPISCSIGRKSRVATRELRSQVRRVAARRRLNGSSTRSADVTDATSAGQRKLEQREQAERLRRRALSSPTNLDDSTNVLPVPVELALGVEPLPRDRVAIARAALDALNYAQRLDLFLERPGEVLLAHAVLTQRHQPMERPSSVG